jgi:hypothetical protein
MRSNELSQEDRDAGAGRLRKANRIRATGGAGATLFGSKKDAEVSLGQM